MEETIKSGKDTDEIKEGQGDTQRCSGGSALVQVVLLCVA